MSEKMVELQPAHRWDCPACGRDESLCYCDDFYGDEVERCQCQFCDCNDLLLNDEDLVCAACRKGAHA